MKIIFLGTNGWYDTGAGNTISILIDCTKYYIVLDAGNGIAKLERYICEDKPVYLFISHFHLDHIEGLHTISMNGFRCGLNILVQEGGKEILERFLQPPFTIPIDKLPFNTDIIEVPAEKDKLPFKAGFLPMLHSAYTLGIRLMIDGKAITYCPDTGYCDNAVLLSRDSDLLITECAFRSGEDNANWPHLNPRTAARIAVESKSKALVLTHFDARRYPSLTSRMEAEEDCKRLFKNVLASWDEMIVKL